MKKNNRLYLLGVFLISLFLFQACKKDHVDRILEKPSREDSKEDLLKDSIYLYTYYFYLWQDKLPESFQTRSYKTAEDVLEALKAYTKDPVTNETLDHYSFIDRSGAVNEEIQEGRAGSFGFDVRYQNDNDLYVKLVNPNSPAALAGIERSWQILSINGNTKIDNATLEADNYSFLWNALDASTIQLTLRKPDNTVIDLTLQSKTFNINPILYSAVHKVGAKQVGYFVFDSFVATTTLGNKPTSTKNTLDQLFKEFESKQVQEVVVDLRYNGGGAVETAEYLSNMLAPLSVGKDKLMYSYGINASLNEDEDWRSFFAPSNFNKTNSLNINRVYFLVTGGTASASELLINNLKPYVDVKLIGEKATYGKPVGFFPWTIMQNDLYAVSFKTINANGESDYFKGMLVDKYTSEDLTKNWGNPEDLMLKEALNYASTGTFTQTINLQSSIKAKGTNRENINLNQKLDQHGNKDMFDFRKKVPSKLKDTFLNR